MATKIAPRVSLRKAARKPRATETETNQLQTQSNKLRVGNLLKNKKGIALLGIAVIVIVVLLYIFRGIFVAAFVNGEPISRLSVVKILEAQSGKATLDNLITKKLILREAKKRNISVTKNDVDTEIKKIEENLKGQSTTLDQALETRGMTKKQLEEEIKIQLSIQLMVKKDIKVTEKEVNDFVTANKDQFPEATTAAQIKIEATNQLKQQKQQEEIQKLIQELQEKAKILRFVQY